MFKRPTPRTGFYALSHVTMLSYVLQQYNIVLRAIHTLKLCYSDSTSTMHCYLYSTTANVTKERVICTLARKRQDYNAARRFAPSSGCERHKHPRSGFPSPSRCRAVRTIRPDLASLPLPCQRTKLDSRPAQYNSNLWMDKGLPSSQCDYGRVSFANHCGRVGRRILYSAPSTSMRLSDVGHTPHHFRHMSSDVYDLACNLP